VIILTKIKFHTIFYAYKAFKTNMVKKGCVIINAENFKKHMALRDSVFPFGHEGHLNTQTVFSHSHVKG
jgi:hypothetical protein